MTCQVLDLTPSHGGAVRAELVRLNLETTKAMLISGFVDTYLRLDPREEERQRAKRELRRAEEQKHQAERERDAALQRAERLAARLRELGIDPE